MDGIVIDIKVFSRQEKDESTKKQEKKKIEKLRRESKKERERIADVRDRRASREMLDGADWSTSCVSAATGEPIAAQGPQVHRRVPRGDRLRRPRLGHRR